MNIYHLKYFIDAAKLGSISKSAQVNRVSHSAISQGIKKLEEYFEVELMYHSKRLFQLTPQGELCLQQGQRFLDSLEEVRENIQHSAREVSGELTICAPHSLIVDSLYRTLALYRKKYPKVRLRIKSGSAAQVRAAFNTGESTVGILVDDGLLENFHTVSIKNGHFVFVGKNKNEDLKTADVIITSRDKIEVHTVMRSFKNKTKQDLNISMEVVSWGVIKNLVRKGFGVGYVPDYCVYQELEAGSLHVVPCPVNTFKYDIKAIWPRYSRLHNNAKLFVDLLQETNDR